MIKLPNVHIEFKQLASTVIARSEKGIATLILKNKNAREIKVETFADELELEDKKSSFDEKSFNYIKDMLSFAPYKIYAVSMPAEEEEDEEEEETENANLNNVLKEIEKLETCWVTIADGIKSEFKTLETWTKKMNKKNKFFKSVVFNAENPDDEHIVNFTTEKVTFKDERKEQSGVAYLPSLIAMLARCNVKRGATYYELKNLESVSEVENVEEALNAGKFILINNDGVVVVAQGINSLTTLEDNVKTEDMKYIEVTEVKDMIDEDIRKMFLTYVSRFKNNLNNQMLFISAVNDYFSELATEEVLDSEYENIAEIDVEAQRKAWIEAGKPEAKTWDDAQVRSRSFKRSMFVVAHIKALNSMCDLLMDINLF